MRALLKNLKPYKPAVIVIVLILIVQAYCDISLPTITADIIDTGIQNAGITHIVPQKTTAEEYSAAQIFMTDGEKKLWRSCFRKDGADYVCTAGEEKLERMDEKLLKPIVLSYQLGHMSVSTFRKTVAQTAASIPGSPFTAEQIEKMSVKEIASLLHLDVRTFRAEDENGVRHTYVDMRSAMENLIESGMMPGDMIAKAQDKIDQTIDSVGSETLRAMGISYAKECCRKAGVDVDRVQKSYLWSAGRKMFLMAGLMMLAGILVAFIASRVGARVGRDLRGKLFENVLRYSNAEIDRFQTSSLITRCTNDVQQVQLVTTMLLRMLLYAPVLGVFGVVRVYQTGAHMSWVIFLGVVVIVAIVGLLMRVTLPKFRKMQTLIDALNGVSREILTGISVIRAFGREKTEAARFDKANTDLMKTQLFTNRAMTFMQPGMMMIMNGLVVLITWVASHRIDTGTMQVGTMTAFITYSMMIVMAFMMITIMSIMLPRAGVAAERIDEVLGVESSIREKPDAAPLNARKGRVEFSNVSFRYPGAEEKALDGISFTAEPGETTAIIGSTGSGKSTLVNLLPRFYDVTEGSVRIDGQDIRDVTIRSLRDEIAFVPQKGVLFSGTIADNIRFGNEHATDEEVRTAAEIAQADDFIEQKEQGYESFVAQGGSNVSGGQKQRLAIARAVAKNAPVLVFDDSFSALDMKTDAALRKRLAETNREAVKIIVAQRISTILNAEQILVLDDGKLVGKGTHRELMKDCDVYRQIAESQLSAKELEAID